MGFFVRTKKVKKESPKSPPKGQRHTPPKYRPVLPPPPTQVSQSWDPYRQPVPFQPAGLLPPPPGWTATPQPPTAYIPPGTYPPIVVNQHHYYLGGPPPSQAPEPPRTEFSPPGKLNLEPAVNWAKEICQATCVSQLINQSRPLWSDCGSQLVGQGNAVMDQVSNRFDHVLTMIDRGNCDGKEQDLMAWAPMQSPSQSAPPGASAREKGLPKGSRKPHSKGNPKGQTTAAATVVSGSIFSRVDRYANSRLPMDLPPLKLYISTYPLLCLAAQYSERVYDKPSGSERHFHVDADWKAGTKAMVIKSMPMDYMNTIVFAIRGTASFMDWAVNLNMEPKSPEGFLDDPGNLCHAGFLSVARKMVAPVARRLCNLLEEDPGRASYSLLITGHSAGGAVASLLYSHMLAKSKSAESQLNAVASCFKRVHCITFGTPPVSLMPLTPPRPPSKNLFLSFVNEGDPVARADKAYVKSLLELFVAPAPPVPAEKAQVGGNSTKKPPKGDKMFSRRSAAAGGGSKTKSAGPVWKVPPNTLSCAGQIVVLRTGSPKARLSGKKTTVEERIQEGVVAQLATDEQLRTVIWGDPVSHMMKLYAGRIETLAVNAVIGQGA